jgi:RecA-family ATPase
MDLRVGFVSFDTASDGFAGNENDRGQVRQFVQRGLGSIALAVKGPVLCLAHPSRAGIKNEEGDGGSTGWSNSFRSRLFIRTPAFENGEPSDPNARILQRRKANYASRNDELRLRWRQGVIEPEPDAGTTAFGKLDAGDVFIDLLRARADQERPVSANSRAGNYAPREFEKAPREQRLGFKKADFEKAMNRLFTDGKIANAGYGRKGDERTMIVISGGETEND